VPDFYLADVSPQLRSNGSQPVNYRTTHCPVSERAAYEEAVCLPQFLLIGNDSDMEDIARAVAKVMKNLESLAGADPALAGTNAMSRADRPKYERVRNY
jgi:hypothetical protein